MYGRFFGVLAFQEDAALGGLVEARGFQVFKGLEFIKAPEEEEVCNLLDDFERIGDAAGPEGVPDGVDLATNFATALAWEYKRLRGQTKVCHIRTG